ncbi:MAG: YdiU family protein [Clostridium sp.]
MSGFNFKNTYIELPEEFYTYQRPTSVSDPSIVVYNSSLAQELGINLTDDDVIRFLSGNILIEGSEPISQAYAGHQFGHFTMLGDGRAILLGEHITPSGKRFDVQLKGPGRTAYSRGGDGRAALGPMLREYIISEGMHGLRIPTTRSLAVVETGEDVYRDTVLKGAVLTRIASSHIRVGTFQFARWVRDVYELQELADYTIDRHYPECRKAENPYLELLKRVVEVQVRLIVKWNLVGFIHGVMNTDNVSISGETIDYGPCAFMDVYNPSTVFSSIDRSGRYSYKNQPSITVWNLSRFAETLIPLIHEDEETAINLVKEELAKFQRRYTRSYIEGMGRKIGLSEIIQGDSYLIEGLLTIMQNQEEDYTNTFVALTREDYSLVKNPESEDFKNWLKLWRGRLSVQGEDETLVKKRMMENNPVIIPRNHLVEEALSRAEDGDISMVNEMVSYLKSPFDYNKDYGKYAMVDTSNKTYRTFCGT